MIMKVTLYRSSKSHRSTGLTSVMLQSRIDGALKAYVRVSDELTL